MVFLYAISFKQSLGIIKLTAKADYQTRYGTGNVPQYVVLEFDDFIKEYESFKDELYRLSDLSDVDPDPALNSYLPDKTARGFSKETAHLKAYFYVGSDPDSCFALYATHKDHDNVTTMAHGVAQALDEYSQAQSAKTKP